MCTFRYFLLTSVDNVIWPAWRASKNGRCCEGGGQSQFLLTFVDNVSAARERMFICIYRKVSVLKVRMNVEIKLSATTIKVKDT